MRLRRPTAAALKARRERRAKARQMARIEAGANAVTKRQLRRLPSRETVSAIAKAAWMVRRIARRQGLTVAEITGA